MDNKILVTQSHLKELLDYDIETGEFRWKVSRRGGVKIGDLAGCDNGQGYTVITIGRKLYRAHRLAFLWMTGSIPNTIDHANGCRSDNSWENLRACTNSQNSHNYKKPSNNTSGAKGVSWHEKIRKWVVRVSVRNKTKHIGCFAEFELAELIASEVREKYHGSFARHA